MASIAFQVQTTQDGTLSRSKTVSDADATRLIAAYQMEANVSVNGTATRAQVWNYIVNSVYSQWVAKVRAHEESEAIATVQASVSPITLT